MSDDNEQITNAQHESATYSDISSALGDNTFLAYIQKTHPGIARNFLDLLLLSEKFIRVNI